MLKKCLKYDLKSIVKIWTLFAATLLVLSPIAGLALRSLLLRMDDMIFPWETLLLMGGCFMLWAFLLVILVMVYIRFYTNFFKDEGYLTFTLPVSRSTLFLSKVLNATIYEAASMAVILLSLAITLAIAPDPDEEYLSLLGRCLAWIVTRLGFFFDTLGFGAVVLILEAMLLLLLLSLTKTLFYYFAITLGASISRKHPILMTVVLIYAVNTILPTLLYPCLFGLVYGGAAAELLYPAAFTGNTMTALVLCGMLIACIAVAIVDLFLWFASLDTIERKLNLA